MPDPDLPLSEETGKAWVLDALERLDDQSFVFVMGSVRTLMARALLDGAGEADTIELAEAIDVYLGTRGVSLPY